MIMKFIFSMILAYMPGIIGIFWTPYGMDTNWFNSLVQPLFTPTLNMFIIIWVVLYTMLGIALFLVLKPETETKNTDKCMGLFLTNIALISSWYFVFFYKHFLTTTIIIVFILLTVQIIMQKHFAKENKYAGWLVIPHVISLVFLLYLSIGIKILN